MKQHRHMNRRHRLIAVVSILLILIVAAICFGYLSDYYRADTEAISTFIITQNKKSWVGQLRGWVTHWFPSFLLCHPQPVSCSSHDFKMPAAPGITPDKTEFRVREAVSSYGRASLGSKRNLSQKPPQQTYAHFLSTTAGQYASRKASHWEENGIIMADLL